MNRSCHFCGHQEFTCKQVQYVYKRDDQFLVINNVPCEVCNYCGEQYFKADVLKKIERDFFNIESGKKTTRKLAVPIEEFMELG